MKITETHIQALLMNWVMNKKHHCLIIPNSNTIFNWEADLLTVNKSNFIHEFEIKLNIQDYRADTKKIWKHKNLKDKWGSIPNYFWYVTYEFEIEPPKYAGWILINKNETWWNIIVKKNAPRLTDKKITQYQKDACMRIISHQLRQEYEKILKNWKNE